MQCLSMSHRVRRLVFVRSRKSRRGRSGGWLKSLLLDRKHIFLSVFLHGRYEYQPGHSFNRLGGRDSLAASRSEATCE